MIPKEEEECLDVIHADGSPNIAHQRDFTQQRMETDSETHSQILDGTQEVL